MKNQILVDLTFGQVGNAAAHLLYGWSLPEHGHTWTNGPVAALTLTEALRGHPRPRTMALEIHFQTFHSQRITARINGQEIGRSQSGNRSTLAWLFEPAAVATALDHLILSFDLPDASVPENGNDPRMLGLMLFGLRIFAAETTSGAFHGRGLALPIFKDAKHTVSAVEALVGKSAREIVLGAESFGTNCEMGFVQREFGTEPLGLLRFAGVWLYQITASIDARYEGLGNPASIDPVLEETTLADWVIYERQHGLRYHTWVKAEDATAEQMVQRETKRLKFLRDKLLEDIADGHKTFVVHDRSALALEQVLPIFLALSRHAAVSLLYIVPATEETVPGQVREVLPGLFKGAISRFSSGPDGRVPRYDEWLCMLAAVDLLRHPR